MTEVQVTNFDYVLICCILLIGSGVLIGVFRKMKDGFGEYNLKVVLLTTIVIFTTLLAVYTKRLDATLGILGAIVGYLFGVNASSKKHDD